MSHPADEDDPPTRGPTERLQLPAFFLLLFAGITFISIVPLLPQHIESRHDSPFRLFLAVVSLTANGISLLGSIHMMLLRSYRLAVAAAVVSMIPFLSGCVHVGIPFGMWAFSLLRKAEVRRRFKYR